MTLALPKSRAGIAVLQSARKRVAVERARRAPYYKGRLDHIDLDRLDDPDHWRGIPILDKDQLRAIAPERFYADFCIAPRGEIAEYWRSGGSTGRPLFYPRTFADIRYGMVGFARTFEISGCGGGDRAHLSFPLGIHPAGHVWARSAFALGIGINWVGAGNTAPTRLQIELLDRMRPNLWMGMTSYGIHLANAAAGAGIDPRDLGVEKILCTAEAMTAAKRARLERMWGAEVYDNFGMTECTMMAGESAHHDGLHVWTDLAFIEVLDERSLEPVAEGDEGVLIVTPLWTNNATPFLRWNSGDIVTFHQTGATDGPFSVFPMIRHAHRTLGFFKVRGANINHADLEEFLFAQADVSDFKAEILHGAGGLDEFRLSVEAPPDGDERALAAALPGRVKAAFEVTPEVRVLPRGSLAAEFETAIKAPRFVDRRG